MGHTLLAPWTVFAQQIVQVQMLQSKTVCKGIKCHIAVWRQPMSPGCQAEKPVGCRCESEVWGMTLLLWFTRRSRMRGTSCAASVKTRSQRRGTCWKKRSCEKVTINPSVHSCVNIPVTVTHSCKHMDEFMQNRLTKAQMHDHLSLFGIKAMIWYQFRLKLMCQNRSRMCGFISLAE